MLVKPEQKEYGVSLTELSILIIKEDRRQSMGIILQMAGIYFYFMG